MTLDSQPARVLGLLREQAALFVKLETLAGRQRALVAGEAMEPLMSVLADRQRVSTRLAEISGLLKPVRRLWQSYRARFDVAQRAEADRLVIRTRESLERLLQGDERDARILSARKQRVANLLSEMNTVGGAVEAYGRTTQTTRRVDLVSEDA